MTVRRVLVTGAAGFIGSHLVDSLLAEGSWRVTALDNFDPLYEPALKEHNVEPQLADPRYRLLRCDIRNPEALEREAGGSYDVIVHLAARPGVRASVLDPIATQEVNVRGTQNLLELARRGNSAAVVFASSSSVYGINPNVPWREDDPVLRPISPYAGTKVSGELLGHVYSHLYGIRFVALRFFTVYGPRQRPDLAIHKFARLMTAGAPVPLFGDGSTRRDYTFIDDVVRGVRAAMDYAGSGFEVFNLGNNRTISLREMLDALERALHVRAVVERLPEQPGDVPQTWASLDKAERLLGYHPRTAFAEGLERFVEWFQGRERRTENGERRRER